MTLADRVDAAKLYLPPAARVTGITRIQQLGLEMGPVEPVHFVIDSDLHLSTPGIVLHRTASMPPSDDDGVTPAAAFIAYGTQARLIDLVAVGDWLLHRSFMTEEELLDLLQAQPWRDGAHEVRKILSMLRPRSRSIPESKLRLLLEAAGIVGLEVNAPRRRLDGRLVEIDLLATSCGMAIEYEGAHHQKDRGQYLTDIDRYAAFRAMKLPYSQVTKEAMRVPRAMVLNVYDDLVSVGYQGPRPEFGRAWRALFRSVRRPRAGQDAPRARTRVGHRAPRPGPGRSAPITTGTQVSQRPRSRP